MQGFDAKFQDFPDYVLGVSEAIWEGRGLGAKVREYYHPDVIQRTPGGVLRGIDAVAADVLATQALCSERRLLGEDVICSVSDEPAGSGSAGEGRGRIGAHRALTTARLGCNGPWGVEGQALCYREMTDVHAVSNKITDVWRITDTGAIARQTGSSPEAVARRQVYSETGETQPLPPPSDPEGIYTGRGNEDQWALALAALLERAMAGDLSVIADQYDRACQLTYAGGASEHGWSNAKSFWLGLRAAFPSATFEVHHRFGVEAPLMPPRAALRWSLRGRHDGWGRYGRPTGADVHVMGMSHAEFGPRGLRRDWTLVDDVAIWTQIVRHQG